MIITEKMQKELESKGYNIEDFKNIKDTSELSPDLLSAYKEASEKIEEEQTKENELEYPLVYGSKDNDKPEDKTFDEQLFEANRTLGFSENQVYVFDKDTAMDMAAKYAKDNKFSKAKVQKAVAEIVESRSRDYYGEKEIVEDEVVEAKEDEAEYYIAARKEEQEIVEEESDRMAYPEISDYQYEEKERTRYPQ